MSKEPEVYEIRTQGHLAPHRLRGFDGLTVTHQPNGETVLVGPISDQSALYGLLNWLHDLGAPLVSVRRLEGREEVVGPATKSHDPCGAK